jgi:hypothetical protein
MKMIQTLLMVALTGLCLSASAQWQWINKDGHKVFSDRAPPADILDKNIVKRPGGRAPSVAPPADIVDDSALPPITVSPAVSKTTGPEKDLETKKKKAEQAEVAKRKAEEEQVTKARIENCVRAKQAKATYESGVPVARTNASGQREVMDEAARAGELRRILGIMESDCK